MAAQYIPSRGEYTDTNAGRSTLGSDALELHPTQFRVGDNHFLDTQLGNQGGNIVYVPNHGDVMDAQSKLSRLVADDAHRIIRKRRVLLNLPHDHLAGVPAPHDQRRSSTCGGA